MDAAIDAPSMRTHHPGQATLGVVSNHLPPAAEARLAEIRRSGIAFDDGEFNLEVRCVAVPVQDFTGQTIGALGISGPIWRLSIQALQSRAKIVQTAADRLSGGFGAKGPASHSR